MRNFILMVALMLAVFMVVLVPVRPAHSQAVVAPVDCGLAHDGCHAYETMVWNNCRARGGYYVPCLLESDQAYVQCILPTGCGL